MSRTGIPTYTRIAYDAATDMYECAQHVEGSEEYSIVYRPARTCQACGRDTVNWTTRMVPKAQGGVITECDRCRDHRGQAPLLEEEAS